MTTYTLQVSVGPSDLRMLKESDYKLCIGMQVNGSTNVVWQGSGNFLSQNQFQWTPEFAVFGVDNFRDGALVQASTNQVSIRPGQTALLDDSGIMEGPTGPASGDAFKVANQYGRIQIGVSAKIGSQFHPCYVTQNGTVGITSLMPKMRILVWWSREFTTGTMFTESVATSHEIDMPEPTTYSVAYSNGTWVNQ